MVALQGGLIAGNGADAGWEICLVLRSEEEVRGLTLNSGGISGPHGPTFQSWRGPAIPSTGI